ncbi:MAG: lasso peptide biosynthesis B2 protein [Anaerolineae bacterium]|nr:lasso peptide biosynthesis B2 protein [Anaerolineae bacterium]
MTSSLRTLRARWNSFSRLSTPQKALALEALLWLLVSMLAVKLVPFRYWSRFLGAKAAADSLDETPECPDTVREVSQAINRVNRVFRGRFTCLMQATAGKAMLNRRGIPNTLALGARTVRAESAAVIMEAHAWLKCGSFILLGGEAHDRFTVVAQFHSPAPPVSRQS